MAGFTVLEPMEIRMLIKRILVAIALVFGALHANAAASDGTDSHCVVGKNNSLFNQCNYSVDVGFCVENPQQTKHFYDNSKAFECPGGALIALPAGLQDGNILHGKVHWWACSIKHRAGNKWRYVEGVGYRGYCFKEGADQAQPIRQTPPDSRQTAQRLDSGQTAQRPVASSSSSPSLDKQRQSSNSGEQRALSLSDCVPEQNAFRAAMFARHGDTFNDLGSKIPTQERFRQELVEFVRGINAASRQRLLEGLAFLESRRALSPPGSYSDAVSNIDICFHKARLGMR